MVAKDDLRVIPALALVVAHRDIGTNKAWNDPRGVPQILQIQS